MKQKSVKTIDIIIDRVDTSRGAPMGRDNVDERPAEDGLVIDKYLIRTRIFDCAVPMSRDGAYDKGGAYWGHGSQLRVKYTKDLKYIEFYRLSAHGTTTSHLY